MNRLIKTLSEESSRQEDDLQALSQLRRSPPPGFQQRVAAAVSELEKNKVQQDNRGWLAPATRLAGALAVILIDALSTFLYWQRPIPTVAEHEQPSYVEFKLNAPGAAKVELIGDFTAWQSGEIQFDGPDEDGNWKTKISLPEGRYEYLFLVDGQKWVTDLSAPAHRPDGFGNLNAVINL